MQQVSTVGRGQEPCPFPGWDQWWSVQGRHLHSRGALLLLQLLPTTTRRGFVVESCRVAPCRGSGWLASLRSTGIGMPWSCHQCPPLGCCYGPTWLCLPQATHSCFLPVPRCQPGWFNLQPHNPAGCSSCFCYGHSTACTAADGYEVTYVRSDFSQGTQRSALGETEGTAVPTSAKKLQEFGEAGAEHPALRLSISLRLTGGDGWRKFSPTRP